MMEWYWIILIAWASVTGIALIFALAIPESGDVRARYVAITSCWPITFPRMLWIEMSSYLFRRCVKCEVRIRAKAKFCPKCGVKQ